MPTAKELLVKIINRMNEEEAKELLDKLEDYLLQKELESDEEFLKTLERVRNGEEELIPHDEVLKRFKP